MVTPLVATEDFRNLYARPNATFAWICGFMNVVEASGLSLTRGPSTAGSATIALSLRDPAGAGLRKLFEFRSRDLGYATSMFVPDVALSGMKNIRVDQATRPMTDTQWVPGRLACQVVEE